VFQPYRELRQAVESLSQAIAQDDYDCTQLKPSFLHLQTLFQTKIQPLELDALEPPMAHQIQSFNVEIDKQLRLLNMDVMFLQAAKQAATTEKRLNQVRDRLMLLIRYCNGVLGEEPEIS
jgi:hypothetical protein